MGLQKTFDIPLYECKVKFIVSQDARKTVNRLYKKHNTKMTFPDEVEGFMLTMSMNQYYIIVDAKHLTFNTVCHELFHLTKAITTDRNVFEEEQQAWVQGFCANEIFSYLKSKKVVIA